MMNTGRWLALAALVAALAMLSYYAQGGGDWAEAVGPAPNTRATTSSEVPTAIAPDAPGARGADGDATRAEPPTTDGTNEPVARTELAPVRSKDVRAATPASESEPPSEDPRPYLLRGLVQGPDAIDGGETIVRARLRSRPRTEVQGTTTPDGHFELDVTALLDKAETLRRPTDLVVVADHPDFMPNEGSIQASRRVFAADRVANAYSARVTVRLEPPYAMLRGRVHGLGEVHVALVLPANVRRKVPKVVEEREAARSGEFQLRVPFDAAYTVLAVAEIGQPIWVDVRVKKKGTVQLEPLRIGSRRKVPGRVELPPRIDAQGSTLVCEPDWFVQLEHAQPFEFRKLLDWHNVTWSNDGGYELRKIEAEVGTQNRFVLDGLAVTDYRVNLVETKNFPPGNPFPGHLLTRGEGEMRLVPGVARVVYRVYDEKGPCTGAKVALHLDSGAFEGTTDSKGRASFVVLSSVEGQVAVTHLGYEPVTRPTTTPFPTRDVHLEVRLIPLAGASLALRFVPVAGAPLPVRVELELSFSDGERTARVLPVQDGTAICDKLRAGEAEAIVRTQEAEPKQLARFPVSLRAGLRTTHPVRIE
ncbi:MAG: hypothetical protein GY711_17560 [bacterium]|nr:hypothetical protein [bacterium]